MSIYLELKDEDIRKRLRLCPVCHRLFLADIMDAYTVALRCAHYKKRNNEGYPSASEFRFLNE